MANNSVQGWFHGMIIYTAVRKRWICTFLFFEFLFKIMTNLFLIQNVPIHPALRLQIMYFNISSIIIPQILESLFG